MRMLFGARETGWQRHLAISAQKLSLSVVNSPLKVNNRVPLGVASGALFEMRIQITKCATGFLTGTAFSSEARDRQL